LRKLNKKCHAFTFALENTADLPSFYSAVSEKMGGLDILVNCAGAHYRERAERAKLSRIEYVVKVNLIAPYILSQCFARECIENNKKGCIIMIASLMSESARPGTSVYTMTKGGIRQLVKALAVDWAPFGIRVNGIGPGYIKTPMTEPLYTDSEFDAWVRQRTPLGRWGMPEDVTGTAVFLASDASAFITGQIIYVDGGWLATF
jgi:gluconate 5-dehydrogenase